MSFVSVLLLNKTLISHAFFLIERRAGNYLRIYTHKIFKSFAMFLLTSENRKTFGRKIGNRIEKKTVHLCKIRIDYQIICYTRGASVEKAWKTYQQFYAQYKQTPDSGLFELNIIICARTCRDGFIAYQFGIACYSLACSCKT